MNYINFLKDFFKYKLHTLDASKTKDDFDAISLEIELLDVSVKTIDDIHSKCNLIASKGLKQITPISNGIKNFFKFLNTRKINLDDVDKELIIEYINKECIDIGLSYGTRKNYRNAIISLLTFIDEKKLLKKKFDIEKIEVIEDKNEIQNVTDWLDTPSFVKVGNDILKFNFPNEFERNRDILIFRLFCYSGILPNEMAALTLNNFIFKDDSMILKIDGVGVKKREIPLPKRKLIVYFNKYLELRDMKSKTLFYSPTNSKNKIDPIYLTNVVKKLLIFTKVEVKDKTPKMIRKSYAILLYNEKGESGFTQSEKNIQYLLGIRSISEVRELLKYNNLEVMTASNVFEHLNII